MSHGRSSRARRRLCGAALATALTVTGCLGGGSGDGGGGDAAADGTGEGGKAGDGTFAPDPDLVPETRDRALRFARNVVAKPVSWGTGYVKGSPYKSGPDRTSGLGADCVRNPRPLRPSTLVSITRRSELPARGGTGPLRVAAVVTVHRTAGNAKWEMARTLEEALRCPGQELNATERVTWLTSVPVPPRLRAAGPHRDHLTGTGEIHSAELGGPHPYHWSQSRVGRITVAIVAKGAEGHGKQEVGDAAARGRSYMTARVENELGATK